MTSVGPRRIGLRLRDTRQGWKHGSARGQMQKLPSVGMNNHKLFNIRRYYGDQPNEANTRLTTLPEANLPGVALFRSTHLSVHTVSFSPVRHRPVVIRSRAFW